MTWPSGGLMYWTASGAATAIVFAFVVLPFCLILYPKRVNIVIFGTLGAALFYPAKIGAAYVGFLVAFGAYLYYVEWVARQRLKIEIHRNDWEARCLRKHALYLQHPISTRSISVVLNQLRWMSFPYVPLFCWHKEWLLAVAVLGFFLVMGNISVRFDPLFFYGDDLRRGYPNYKAEYMLLSQVLNSVPRVVLDSEAVSDKPPSD